MEKKYRIRNGREPPCRRAAAQKLQIVQGTAKRVSRPVEQKQADISYFGNEPSILLINSKLQILSSGLSGPLPTRRPDLSKASMI